jgi:hypothetical protein
MNSTGLLVYGCEIPIIYKELLSGPVFAFKFDLIAKRAETT